ncbi:MULTISPECIES: dTDP-4-dehydrorhamnose 3,5-epimerase [Sphingomonas]|uniref:dTDP-4-dehydrorhamnose 3,5-epimerase n=1 Tax=Sphingomonas TaxID=13687 RepID=UPI000DEF6FD0|nr:MULTISPECIES: dTDP-4-dehydrorhamnose 3,5-epimerase [Sphingomonas]
MVEVRQTALPGVLELRPIRRGDERGFFSEVWNARDWAAAGIDRPFVQDNHSCSARGVLRGLHYQLEPFAQAKLVRVSRGRVLDVAVDIRAGSATFGRWAGAILSAEEWNQLFIPPGFAHGFLALEDGCEVQYKVDALYSAAHDRGIDPFDPAIGVQWPMERSEILLSDKDRAAPLLKDAEAMRS